MPEPQPAASPLAPGRPLLSLCIPTFNRAPFLAELLQSLTPAFPTDGSVELLVSDNASTDATPEITARFATQLPLAIHRNSENIGADANFLQCLSLARGRYVWILGDDDILLPNTIPALVSLLHQAEATGGVDLVYLSSIGFTGTFTQPPTAALADRLGRFAELSSDPAYLLNKINALIALISVVLINRDRLDALPHPPFDDLHDSNLIQLGWTLPLLRPGCRVLYVWQRLLAYRHFNSGGWGICEVFGLRLDRIARTLLPPPLARALMNGVLRFWMPDVLLSLRLGRDAAMHHEPISHLLGPRFRRSWRYWLFVWPIATLPLPLARPLHHLLKLTNRLHRIAEALLRRLLTRDPTLHPYKP